MKNRVFAHWDIMRILRLVIGVMAIVQAVVTKDITLALFGGLFTLMPILNVGCCGATGCNATTRHTDKEVKDISYEEVH